MKPKQGGEAKLRLTLQIIIVTTKEKVPRRHIGLVIVNFTDPTNMVKTPIAKRAGHHQPLQRHAGKKITTILKRMAMVKMILILKSKFLLPIRRKMVVRVSLIHVVQI